MPSAIPRTVFPLRVGRRHPTLRLFRRRPIGPSSSVRSLVYCRPAPAFAAFTTLPPVVPSPPHAGLPVPGYFKLLIMSNFSLDAVRSSTLGSSDTSNRREYEHRNRTRCRCNGQFVPVLILGRQCTSGSEPPVLAEFVARSPQDFRTQCRNHSEQAETRHSSGN